MELATISQVHGFGVRFMVTDMCCWTGGWFLGVVAVPYQIFHTKLPLFMLYQLGHGHWQLLVWTVSLLGPLFGACKGLHCCVMES